MFTTGTFPDKLKIATIKPLFTKLIYHLLVILDPHYYHQYRRYLKKLYLYTYFKVRVDPDKDIQLSMRHTEF